MGLERTLGWGPRTWRRYLQVRSLGWSSPLGPRLAFRPGSPGSLSAAGLVTAGPEGGPEVLPGE